MKLTKKDSMGTYGGDDGYMLRASDAVHACCSTPVTVLGKTTSVQCIAGTCSAPGSWPTIETHGRAPLGPGATIAIGTHGYGLTPHRDPPSPRVEDAASRSSPPIVAYVPARPCGVRGESEMSPRSLSPLRRARMLTCAGWSGSVGGALAGGVVMEIMSDREGTPPTPEV